MHWPGSPTPMSVQPNHAHPKKLFGGNPDGYPESHRVDPVYQLLEDRLPAFLPLARFACSSCKACALCRSLCCGAPFAATRGRQLWMNHLVGAPHRLALASHFTNRRTVPRQSYTLV